MQNQQKFRRIFAENIHKFGRIPSQLPPAELTASDGSGDGDVQGFAAGAGSGIWRDIETAVREAGDGGTDAV